MNTILQVPINKELKNKAALAAQKMGFSSLQEAVRVYLNKVASEEITIRLEEVVKLSPKNEKRYEKMINEIETGKVKLKSFDSVEALMEDLNK